MERRGKTETQHSFCSGGLGPRLFDLGIVQGHMLELSGRKTRSTRMFDFWLHVGSAGGPTPTVKGSGGAKGGQDRTGGDGMGRDGTGGDGTGSCRATDGNHPTT